MRKGKLSTVMVVWRTADLARQLVVKRVRKGKVAWKWKDQSQMWIQKVSEGGDARILQRDCRAKRARGCGNGNPELWVGVGSTSGPNCTPNGSPRTPRDQPQPENRVYWGPKV
jgi:hypothetical protein